MRKSVAKDYPRLFQDSASKNSHEVNPENFKELFGRLAKSSFRRKFYLDCADVEYVRNQGFANIRHHAEALVRRRLAPAAIANDGHQTPYVGHPVFRAQHATGCCCRGCLEKWHGIVRGTRLTDEQVAYICDVLMAWIQVETSKHE